MLESLELRRLLSAAAAASTAGSDIGATNPFSQGNGKTRADQYPGRTGSGWLAGWSRSSTAISAKVPGGTNSAQPPAIDQIQPDYLQVTASGSNTISRPITGANGVTDRVIQFDYRFNANSSGHDPNDSITIFGDTAGAGALSLGDPGHRARTWTLKARMNQSNAIWEFGYANRAGSVLFLDDQQHGVRIRANDVYQFTIDEHFGRRSGTYTATVRDTTSGAVGNSPSALEFFAKDTTVEHLNFGMSLAGNETGEFSIDAIHVATRPATAPVVFVIGGLGATQFPQPGVLSVQQDYGPLFTYAGIDIKHFRWYEENYDTDAAVNPNADSIAAEIDKVPAGTPVVLMGLSFGGGQAMVSASLATRPIDDLILFDPVMKTDVYDQVNHTDSDPARDHPTQVSWTLPPNVRNAADFGRAIFQADGTLYPKGPYAFTINGSGHNFENLSFPRSTKHQAGQLTPRALTPGVGSSGDPINDTAELVDNAVDGFPLFWDGLKNVGS